MGVKNMDALHLSKVIFILGVLFPYSSWCALPAENPVDCEFGNNKNLGKVNEGYEGLVETLTGIPEGTILTLESWQESTGNTFLQITPTNGGSSALVSTSKPLDADNLLHSGGIFYSIKCSVSGQLNRRTLQINDLNDNAPIFQGAPYSKEITEALAVGSTVLTVKAEDDDATNANNVVSYSIQAPQPPEFSIDTNGVIKLLDKLNYNAATSYTFTVIARDPPGLTATAAVTVTVADYDDLNPYFDHNVYTGSIMENGVGEMISVLPEAIKAQDGDKGINQPVVYSITSVAPSEFSGNVEINANTGVIIVRSALDREQVSSLNIQIKAAQDNDLAKAAYALVVVNVEDYNDNPPEFDKTAYDASIPENSPNGYFVLQTKVTDKDLGGFIGTLRLIPDTVPFTISNDGIITVKTSADLDRETSPSFTFQVEAREDESPNHTETTDVVITLLDVNDNSPQFSSSKYEGKVFSNQTVGMNVVKVEATDADEGVNGEVTYSIGGGNEDGHFALDENSGDITLAKVIILEDNTVKRFSLYVTARDGGEMSRASSALVAIQAPGNSDPQFLATTYHGTVEEEQNPPINIVKVGFYSVGSIVPVTLQVNTHQDLFSIDNNGELSTKAKLDYEVQANYTVSISLSDGTKSDTAEVKVQVLDVNDNSPVFVGNPFTFTLSEDVKLGTNVTVLTATDADSDFNGEVRYFIQGGGGSFGVDPETGRITVDNALDREEADEITFKVVATDQGRPSRSATADVTVTVTDVNDNNPFFAVAQHYVAVSEIDEPGLVLVKLNATDADDDVNAAVTYLIAKQDPASEPPAFAVDAVSGELTLATKLDFGNATRYVLTVEAVDGGTPTLTGIATVTVQVEDVNNNPPEFSQEQYDVAVPENLAGGAVVVSLEVTDKDKDGFSNGHFLMTSDTFNINKMGAISLNSDATLDRESQDTYMLQVVAVDQPVDGLSATAQVNITITDINDNNPEFLPLPDPIAIAEGDYSPAEPGVVCVIEAKDKDVGDNGRVTLSTSSNHTFTFKEDGTLIAVADLDREKQDSYDLVIVATDHGKPQRQTVTNIRVTVTDVNDNDPVFSMETYSKSILAKDAKKGDLVLTIAATDKDAGNNSLITYSITDGASEYISLDPDSGDLVLTSDLAGITEDMMLNITAQAQDQGKPPRSSTATVLIFIRTVSLEDGLVFSRPTYNFSVLEHLLSGSEVGVVLASSGSPLFTVSYTLKTHQDAFSIDSSGLILTRVELDTETEALYVLSVEANDTRTPPNTALTVVTVQVKNVNEAPVFDNKSYKAEIFSNAPFKTPVVQVKAADPDVGDMLLYSLVEPNSMFDIEPSSGQVYVVSLEGESGKETLEVKAEDKHGLYATATVEVTVNEVEDTNVVVISLNQPINAVEKKAPELEQSMGRVLGWTVRIVSISTSNGGASDRSAPIGRESRTYVSFVAMDTSGTAITAEKVKSKLTEEEEQVQSELEKVFGSGLEHEVERGPGESVSDPMQIAVIALGTLLGLSIVGIIVLTVVSVKKFRNMKKEKDDSELDSFGLHSRHNSVSSGEVNPANSAQSSPQSQRRASKVSKREDNTSEEGSDTDRL